ncbi:LacI family DNA-binding transcriptional regulator [Acidisoma cellulosilytica]|uniref:LacI family DNA-binding transcriptional regulator n=1 Tax=Acidisoma cellulosilyticum TaxID=2802395 RepID=A0A963Z4Y2_9PROT|nr:LacI family DNA-binding transcriptional regulator [Acidisoma cellulosilyticum]MCB8882095.1 LacI family DNA-binding transcriptional regulator [Acidisoma cellulosilyticum]
MERRKIRHGLEDVAQHAGVGIATVDRVLNERGSVSPKTERRVLDAARELGLRRILPAPHARALRIEVMLARSATPFMRRLGAAMGQVAATLDRSVTVIRSSIDMTDPARVAQNITNCRADGIIVYCEEHPANVAAIAASAAAGRPVICVVTDVPDSPRAAYVGIDHTKAGGTAAFFVARMASRPGTALILSTSTGFRAHKQRIDGFRLGLAAHAPGIAVAPVMTTHDDPERAYHHVTQALRQRPDLVAIYNTGGGSAGVGNALRDGGRGAIPIFVGHELTDESAVLLRDGLMTVTIDQAPELQARRAIDLMLSRLGGGADQAIGSEIAFTLHTVENC